MAETTEQLLAPLDPDEKALTPLFQASIDDGMLREIAEADYGWEADKCYPLLQEILRTSIVILDDFQLREVLELIRWSEPELANWSPGAEGRRGHWMRLFACTALLQNAPRNPEYFCTRECDTLAQLVSSAICLGEPVVRAAVAMLAWRFLTYPGDDEDPPFFAFAILLLAAHLERREDRGPWLKQLAEWVEEKEFRARNATSGSGCLSGLTVLPRDAPSVTAVEYMSAVRATVWRTLAQHILISPESPHPREADETLRRLGALAARV